MSEQNIMANHGPAHVVVSMKDALTSARQGDDTSIVTVMCPKAFRLTLNDHRIVQFVAGPQQAPRFLAEHWFAKANGATVYDGSLEELQAKSSAPAVPQGMDPANIPDWRRTDGPTVEEWLEAGRDPAEYPPTGYVSKSSDGEIETAKQLFADEAAARKAAELAAASGDQQANGDSDQKDAPKPNTRQKR